MDLPCSGGPWQDQRWNFFLASRSGIQGPLSLPILHSGIHSLFPSSGD